MEDHEYLGTPEQLGEDDYGIIVTAEGRVKGIWMPVEDQHLPIPASIVKICVEYFGIDPNTENEVSQTLH